MFSLKIYRFVCKNPQKITENWGYRPSFDLFVDHHFLLWTLREYIANIKFMLRKHVEFSHEGIRFPCDLVNCQYIANRSEDLKVHKEHKHEGKNYPCDQCDYIPTKLKYLDRHKKRMHEGRECSGSGSKEPKTPGSGSHALQSRICTYWVLLFKYIFQIKWPILWS